MVAGPWLVRRGARLIITLAVLANAGGMALAEDGRSRYYLGTGEPPPEAWEIMIDNPTDREETMGTALAAMGGEMISYFWGLADGENYITARLPDDPGMVQAMYLSRLSQGVLKDYTFIELMPSADMIDALKRVPEFTTLVE